MNSLIIGRGLSLQYFQSCLFLLSLGAMWVPGLMVALAVSTLCSVFITFNGNVRSVSTSPALFLMFACSCPMPETIAQGWKSVVPYRVNPSIRSESDFSESDLKPENIVPDRTIDDIRFDPASYNDEHGTSPGISDFDDISTRSDRSGPKSESD